MSQQELDAQGEAHDALGTAVASNGRGVLSDPHLLGNFVADLLPDLPRERMLLVTGAEAGIAAEMTQYVDEQHIDPDTAAHLVAQSLSERRAIDPAASMWVTWEYARALGYQVRPYTPPSPAEQPGAIPAAPPTVAVGSGPTMPVQPPTIEAPTTQVPQGPPTPSGPPPGQSWPPDRGPSGRPPSRGASGKKRGIIAAATAVGVVAVYLIVAAVAGAVPFNPGPAPTPHPPVTPTPTATSTPSLAAGVAPLPQLLSAGVADPTIDCKTVNPPFNWTMPGLYDALKCTDPNLPGGHVTAFQLDSTANYLTAWQNFNKWWGFNISKAGSDCPPTGNTTEGFYPWHSSFFRDRTGQVLECGTMGSGSSAAPTYVYAMPTEDAFFLAQDSSYTTLNNWWSNNSMPLNSPSPTSS